LFLPENLYSGVIIHIRISIINIAKTGDIIIHKGIKSELKLIVAVKIKVK
jgi:hypothetical protein